MTEIACPYCSHRLFELEEDHVHCAKCFEIIRFNETRRIAISQLMGKGQPKVPELKKD